MSPNCSPLELWALRKCCNRQTRRLCALIPDPRSRSSAAKRTNKPSWAFYQDLIQAQHSKHVLPLGKLPETFHTLCANGLSSPNLTWECFQLLVSCKLPTRRDYRISVHEMWAVGEDSADMLRINVWWSLNNVMKSLLMPFRTTHRRKLRSHIIIIKNMTPPKPDSTQYGTFCMWWLFRSGAGESKSKLWFWCVYSHCWVFTLLIIVLGFQEVAVQGSLVKLGNLFVKKVMGMGMISFLLPFSHTLWWVSFLLELAA